MIALQVQRYTDHNSATNVYFPQERVRPLLEGAQDTEKVGNLELCHPRVIQLAVRFNF